MIWLKSVNSAKTRFKVDILSLPQPAEQMAEDLVLIYLLWQYILDAEWVELSKTTILHECSHVGH